MIRDGSGDVTPSNRPRTDTGACHPRLIRQPISSVYLVAILQVHDYHYATQPQFVAPTDSWATNFADIAAGLEPVAFSSAAWGDYDQDGDLDILLTGLSATVPVAKIYRYNGGASPTFTDLGAALSPVYQSSVAWGTATTTASSMCCSRD